MNRLRTAVILFTAVLSTLTLTLSGCGGAQPTSATTSTDRLDVVSWWTSGSEATALNTLLASFRQAHPGVEVVNDAVAGGAGSKAIVALAKRLQQNDPPDVWQTFDGRSLQNYADHGAVRDVSSVYAAAALSARMQPTILKSVLHNGKPFGVPTGAHRENVLWFNPALLQRAGVALPSNGYSLATFLSDLAKVKASGTTPLCLGGKDPFTTMELFENTLLSTIGVSGWTHMVDDDLNWRSTRVTTALRQFGAILRYADPGANGLTWDQATKKLTTGDCAFESMNDSAYGEQISDGAQEGKDLGAVPFPGTAGCFLAVVDVFVAATKAVNAKNALAFLSGINQPATQLAFSRAKGSIPVVRDVDVSSLSAYQQDSSKNLWRGPVLLSVTHGEAMSPQFQEGFYNAVSSYVRTRDSGSFVAELEDAVSKGQLPAR